MQKISTLFKRNHDADHLVYDEIVPGNEWVLHGQGTPTFKMDGTACMYQDSIWYKRYDRKLDKKTSEYKAAPQDWIACQESPDDESGHWPGWLPIKIDAPANKWHVEAIGMFPQQPQDGTYELIGPKVQKNPYQLEKHELRRHGADIIVGPFMTLDFTGIRAYLCLAVVEGIVWHHSDGRMAKIKRSDFGFDWPPKIE